METPVSIDINADVGEGLHNEMQLMPHLSSCNIACGGHAGDTTTMTQTVQLAQSHGVKIGAHPSYPDRRHFGRKSMSIAYQALKKSLLQQIECLQQVVRCERAVLHHVKPHGMLYNMALRDETLAGLIVAVVKQIDSSLVLYAPWQSALAEAARRESVLVRYEAFIDRTYTYTHNRLLLVDRSAANAVIHDPQEAFEQVYAIVKKQRITTIERVQKPLIADTFCIHGDNPQAATILKELTHTLKRHSIYIG